MRPLPLLAFALLSTACTPLGFSSSPSVQSIHADVVRPVDLDVSLDTLPDLTGPIASSPSVDLDWSSVDDILPGFHAAGGQKTPEYSDGLATMPADPIQVFELPASPLADVLRAVVVDFAGLALVYPSDASLPVSFAGGPFTAEEAIDALGVVLAGNELTLQRVGGVVVVSATRQDAEAPPATGYMRLSAASPQSLSSMLTAVLPGVSASVVGRDVVFSGPPALVREAVSLVWDLENSARQTELLPWRAVLLSSPDLAAAASELVAVLGSPDDPMSLSFTPLGTRGLVLLTGHNSRTLDEAAQMLQDLDSGLTPTVSFVQAVSEPEPISTALREAFAARITAGTLSVSLVGSQVLLNGSPSSVSAARDLLDKLSPEPTFVEVRAVVAETRRGSHVDRSFTLGFDPASDVAKASVSPSTASLSAGGFSAALSFLDQDTNTRLLATPRLSVAAGSQADLVVGSQVPILTNTATADGETSSSVAYRDAGVKMTVKPVLLSDGRVRLDVSQELSDATQNLVSGLDSPAFSTRSMTTQVVVSPGEVVAVAGLDYDSASLSTGGGASGGSEARKLVVLLSATPADASVRRIAVQDSLRRLNGLVQGVR